MSEPALLLTVDDNHAVATWRRVFVHIWQMHATVAAARGSAVHLQRFAGRTPGAIGMMTIIKEHAPPPSPEVSREVATILRTAPGVRASVVAFEGNGFRAAIVRSVITGLAILARPPYPHFVTGTLSESSTWLIDALDTAGVEPFARADELRAAIEALQRELPWAGRPQ
jgi:hypothetical protein